MFITVNGNSLKLEASNKLPALLVQLGLTDLRFAIAINRQVIPRSEYEQTVLNEGDEVEIVQAVGGG